MNISRYRESATSLSPYSSAWPLRGLVFMLLALTTSGPHYRTLFSFLRSLLHWQLLHWDLWINHHQNHPVSCFPPVPSMGGAQANTKPSSTAHWSHPYIMLSLQLPACSVLICLRVSSPVAQKVLQITQHLLCSESRNRGEGEMLLRSHTCHHAGMYSW